MRRPRRARARASCCGTRCFASCSRSCRADASDCHVLLAGGIHDARSAAMAAASAAAVSERGARVGALMGTAYLFTREATECGRDHAAVPAGGGRRRGHRAAGERPRPRHPLPGLAVRRAVRGRAAQAARRRDRRRGAARTPGAAEHRTPADRSQGGGPAPSSGLVAVEARRAVGAGHVHDRPGCGAARLGDDARRSAQRGLTRQQRAAGSAAARPRRRPNRRRHRPPTSRSWGSAASFRAPPTWRRSGRTSSTRSTRSARSPPSAGIGGSCTTPTRARATRCTRAGAASSTRWRSTRSRWACHRSRWNRSSRSSCSPCCPHRPPCATPATRRAPSTGSAPR